MLLFGDQVDLTSQEADATLAMWEDQMKKFRKIDSIRSLKMEIQAAQSEPAIRIHAYKNDGGIPKHPVLVIGSTIESVSLKELTRPRWPMGKCQKKMNMHDRNFGHALDHNLMR